MVEYPVQELLRALVLRIHEDLFGRALLGNHALVHEHHAVRRLAREAHFMRDDYHGHAVACKAAHDLGDLADEFRIERGGGFIEEHDARLHGQCACNGYALLLAARQLARIVIGAVGETYAIQCVHRALAGVCRIHLASLDQGQRDVAQCILVRKQIELLEHHAYVTTYFARAAHVVKRYFVDPDLAGVSGFKTAHDSQHGALARTGRANEDEHFALAYVEVNLLEHLERAERLGDAGQVDDGLASGLRRDGGVHDNRLLLRSWRRTHRDRGKHTMKYSKATRP